MLVTRVVEACTARRRKRPSRRRTSQLCQDLRRKLTGERPSDRYFKDANKLADLILSGGFEELAGVPRDDILMKY